MKLPIYYQRIEAGLIFLASLYFYSHLHFHLLWFFILLLSIDIFMLGYLVNKVLGAHIYNIGHSYIIPAILLVVSEIADTRILLAAALIWTAHIGMDRALGYGLKLGTSFKNTHLGYDR